MSRHLKKFGIALLAILLLGKSRRDAKPYQYQEYESPTWLQLLWTDETQVGTCQRCGMSDMPVKKPTALDFGSTLCVWCIERGKLHYHLETNTSRNKEVKLADYVDVEVLMFAGMVVFIIAMMAFVGLAEAGRQADRKHR